MKKCWDNKRADYGKAVIADLGWQLSAPYGCSFSEKNIRRMMQSHEVYFDQRNCRINDTTIALDRFFRPYYSLTIF